MAFFTLRWNPPRHLDPRFRRKRTRGPSSSKRGEVGCGGEATTTGKNWWLSPNAKKDVNDGGWCMMVHDDGSMIVHDSWLVYGG